MELWRDLQPILRARKSEDFCKNLVVKCCSLAKAHTNNNFILETIHNLGDFTKTELASRLSSVTVIRSVEKQDLKAREAAHVLLHAIEVFLSNNFQSASGHAARSVDALSKIDKSLSDEILEILKNKEE